MDELERLKTELRAEADALTPAPGARDAAIAAATAHFEKISQTEFPRIAGEPSV